MNGVISWVGTWLMMVMLLVVLSKTKWGAPIVYGFLWLAVLLLLLTHAEELTSFFNIKALELNG